MTRGVFLYLVAPLVCVGLLSGCRFDLFDRREPWRLEAEEKCIAEKGVTVSEYVVADRSINGRGICGMEHPFRVTALDEGTVALQPQATLACPILRNVNIWIEQVVQPAAMAWMGQPVTGIKQMSSYSCRGMNGSATAKISEHAFGNALDIGAFQFADGRQITVKDNWRGPADARGFLLQVQAGACDTFTTVLAPGSNAFHYDHIHVDLMRHQNGRTICKPKPSPMPPPVQVARHPQEPMPVKADVPGGYQPLEAPLAPQLPPQSALPPQPGHPPAGQPLDLGHTAPEPQPPYARAPGAPVPQQSYPGYARPAPGSPAPAYPPPGDPTQGVVLPPGAVPQPTELRPPSPMSFAGQGATGRQVGPFTVAPAQRKYFSVPIPQASTLPLPPAVPGED